MCRQGLILYRTTVNATWLKAGATLYVGAHVADHAHVSFLTTVLSLFLRCLLCHTLQRAFLVISGTLQTYFGCQSLAGQTLTLQQSRGNAACPMLSLATV